MAVYGYARVSTSGQVDRESLGAQERTIKGQAYALGFDMDTVRLFVEEGVTASISVADRPEGGKLIAALQGGDTIIVAFFDRMFRDALDALQTLKLCRDKGVNLHIMDLGGDVLNSPFSTAIFTIIAALAQLRREEIAGRVKWSKKDQKERGRYLGGDVPWGYVVAEGALVESPDRAPAIDAMRTLRGQGMSLRCVAEEMRRRGVPISHEKVRQAIAA